MEKIDLSCLDHVAIRVKDLEATVNWYCAIFNLEKYVPKKWNGVPIFLLAGKTGFGFKKCNY